MRKKPRHDKILFRCFLFQILFLTFSSSANAREYPDIQQYLKPGTITFIGEIHGRIESMKLIKDLLTHAIIKQQCLTLALEIDSDQQPILDKVMAGKALVSDIRIAYAIDHQQYRSLLKYIARKAPVFFLF